MHGETIKVIYKICVNGYAYWLLPAERVNGIKFYLPTFVVG